MSSNVKATRTEDVFTAAGFSFSKRDPRGAEYGTFEAWKCANGYYWVCNATLGYQMRFSTPSCFLNWAKSAT